MAVETLIPAPRIRPSRPRPDFTLNTGHQQRTGTTLLARLNPDPHMDEGRRVGGAAETAAARNGGRTEAVPDHVAVVIGDRAGSA